MCFSVTLTEKNNFQIFANDQNNRWNKASKVVFKNIITLHSHNHVTTRLSEFIKYKFKYITTKSIHISERG